MNKLVSDGSVKKINYPVLYESGITPPLCEVSAPEPDAGGKRIVAYVYKSSRSKNLYGQGFEEGFCELR